MCAGLVVVVNEFSVVLLDSALYAITVSVRLGLHATFYAARALVPFRNDEHTIIGVPSCCFGGQIIA